MFHHLLEGLGDVVPKAVSELQAAAKKLGVNVTGPRIIYTTNFGDQKYTFDVAVPIDASSLTVGGQSYQLAAATPPTLDNQAPASSSTAPAPAESTTPGSKDRNGRLIVDDNVRALLAFGGPALTAKWNGTAVGVKNTREQLEAYADTHGLKFDEILNRSYDIEVAPEVKDASGAISTYAQYDVYLPIADSTNMTATLPQQTPEQQAGIKQPGLLSATAPASSSTAPAPASTSAAPASGH